MLTNRELPMLSNYPSIIAYARAVEQAAYAAAYRAVKSRDTGDMQREDIEARR